MNQNTPQDTKHLYSYIGVDVAKNELVCCHLTEQNQQSKQTKTFKNNKQGYQRLITWVKKIHPDHLEDCKVIMEATSSYWQAFAMELSASEIPCSVVQPLRIAHFSKVLFKRSKSDPADAHTIALYGLQMKPEAWVPLSKEHQQSKSLSRRIKQIQKQLNAENNHLEHTSDSYCRKDIKALIRQLKTRLDKLKEKLKELVPTDTNLKQQYELIQTIVGIGEQSGATIIAELPNLTEFENARQLAAWAGLTPKHHQSGNSSKSRTPISKIGSNNLREALFFPALVAARFNPLLRNFRERLLENGKTKLEAICAVMRKLLHIIFGMLKNNTPFNPNHLNQTELIPQE